MGSCKINQINTGDPSYATGHVVFSKARRIDTNKDVIYKQNKHGTPTFSRLEESFTKLAQLFLFPDLTSSQELVVDNDDESKILGLLVEHFCYSIEKKEGLECAFHTLNNPWVNCDTTAHIASTASELRDRIYFFNKLPQGFFAQLINDPNIKINYESLASILTTSYTLEEDDLHKGNFGFYLVEKNDEVHAVFFKIDHDLMFVDSLMGFQTRRPFHLFHGPEAFNVHPKDLLDFPNLTYSANSYWPTKFGYLANPLDNKEYHNYAEIDAFSGLAKNDDFIKAKWKSFYKHILISTALIEEQLKGSADVNEPIERAHVALISQAMVARLAHLRACLFSIKEFRDEVLAMNDEGFLAEQGMLEEHFQSQIQNYRALCSEAEGFEEGDTPLHTAIKLGEYRYIESLRMFGQYINIPNAAGKTPLDVALERKDRVSTHMGDDMNNVMKHLLKHGAEKTTAFENAKIESEIQNYVFQNPELARITFNLPYQSASGADFKSILRDIGEDHTLCLKHKKNRAIECIKLWIDLRKNQPGFQQELEQLKKDINNESSEEEAAGVKYIRQLRSRLWIVRQFRGLYGRSTSLGVINQLVNQAIEAIKPSEPGCYSFFARKKEVGPSDDYDLGASPAV